MTLPSIALLVAAGVLAPPAHAEAWNCRITAASNPAIVLQEGRFEVVGDQLFGPTSDAVPLSWRMKIVKNTPARLLAENETGPDRQLVVIDKQHLSIATYSVAYRAEHHGTCTRDA